MTTIEKYASRTGSARQNLCSILEVLKEVINEAKPEFFTGQELSQLDLVDLIEGGIQNCDYITNLIYTLNEAEQQDRPTLEKISFLVLDDQSEEVPNGIGIVAQAHILIPIKSAENIYFYHTHTINSAGLYGIDSDHRPDYLRQICIDEAQDLTHLLKTLNVNFAKGRINPLTFDPMQGYSEMVKAAHIY